LTILIILSKQINNAAKTGNEHTQRFYTVSQKLCHYTTRCIINVIICKPNS